MYSELPVIPLWVIVFAQTTVGGAMLLTLWRIARGPTVMDRIVALDLFAALIMAQLVTLVLTSGFVSYLNAAAAIAVISFIATVALARYLETQEDAS
ncbi:monovalent cation/H+ antiporter complex subunit F [Cerasicoccus fimbriatus]|uniref:monovalent cation/H+ antiporter complex subunit F n=1 Tax=Cerasicoccus fimbriatus TaxID=3014554 RepID=UPI0022B56AA1|nr:monovalent cation/H+ antiporter complex subunit F [Cerasicoccus sp. TK19100]